MADLQQTRRFRFWLTAGEVVGVLALIIAGLNLWESHQQRLEDSRRATTAAQAQAAFVATGAADRSGAHIAIAPLKAAQAIQSERYTFPGDISATPREISAARPQIDLGWIAPGLGAALQAAHVKGAGQGHMPVVIDTTYVEDGDERTDTSLYRIGYSWRPKFLGGLQIRLDGLSLIRRGVSGDASRLVETRWQAERPRLPSGG